MLTLSLNFELQLFPCLYFLSYKNLIYDSLQAI